MNREQIIQMARDAGFAEITSERLKIVLVRFANDIRAATKEEDAKICDLIEEKNTRQGPADCAVAIRASK